LEAGNLKLSEQLTLELCCDTIKEISERKFTLNEGFLAGDCYLGDISTSVRIEF